jgi:tripartite-type tricarboxylate transporter receptor subunit TctC
VRQKTVTTECRDTRARRHAFRDRRFAALAAMTLALLCTGAHAQTWPSKPVRVIVPFPPGGGTDVIGRILSQRFSTAFGQQFVVDNRAGAAGRIGTETAARAAPDGYTLLFTTTSTIITPPALFPKLPLNDEMRKAAADPGIRKRLELDGSRVVSSTPDELRNTISAEIAKWTKLVKAAGIHVQ